MKSIILIILFAFFINVQIGKAQTNFPKGTYMSVEEILSKSPSGNYNIQIQANTKSGDAKVKALDKTVSKKMIKEDIWAISNGDHLILNTDQFDYKSSYVTIISEGKYLAFRASEKPDPSSTAVLMGGNLMKVAGTKSGLYVMNSKDGIVYNIDKDILNEFLEPYPELQGEFENEKSQNGFAVHLKYIEQINLLNQ